MFSIQTRNTIEKKKADTISTNLRFAYIAMLMEYTYDFTSEKLGEPQTKQSFVVRL